MRIKQCEQYGTVNRLVTKIWDEKHFFNKEMQEEVLEFFNKEMRNKD